MKPIRFISYYAALVALSFDSLSVTGFSIHAATQCSTASLTRSATTSMGDIDRAYEKPNLFLNFHHAPKTSQSRLFFTPGVEENNGEKKNESFIRPAIHNSPIFRIISILYAVLFAVHSTSGAPAVNSFQKLGRHLIIPPKAAATAHLLSFATWFGTVVYTTFLAGITMFKNLPRRTFGTLQSKLFPLYFQLCAAMIGVQVLTLTAMPDIISKASEVSLAVSFVATLINLVYLEPTSTRVMFDRYVLEDDGKSDSDEYISLAKSFGRFHGMSSLANLIALCGGIVHGVRIASVLVV